MLNSNSSIKFIRPSLRSYPYHVYMLELYYSHNPLINYVFWTRLSSLLELLNSKEEHEVLEIGFGPGTLLPTLASCASEVVGLAPDTRRHFLGVRQMCKNEEIGDKVQLVRGSIQNVPFREGSFDVIIAADVLEHTPQVENALKEVKNVLRAGGAFLVSIPLETLYRRILRLLLRRPAPLDLHNHSSLMTYISKIYTISKIRCFPAVFSMFILLRAVNPKESLDVCGAFDEKA